MEARIPYGALAQAPRKMGIRCERVKQNRTCRKPVGEVIQLGRSLVLLHAPHSIPAIKNPPIKDFDGEALPQPDGWMLERSWRLGIPNDSRLARRVPTYRAPALAGYWRHAEREALGHPAWSASMVDEYPIVVACICCEEIRVLSGRDLKRRWSRGCKDTSIDHKLLYSGDSDRVIREYLRAREAQSTITSD